MSLGQSQCSQVVIHSLKPKVLVKRHRDDFVVSLERELQSAVKFSSQTIPFNMSIKKGEVSSQFRYLMIAKIEK